MIHIVDQAGYVELIRQSLHTNNPNEPVSVKVPAYCGHRIANMAEAYRPHNAVGKLSACPECLAHPDFELALLAGVE